MSGKNSLRSELAGMDQSAPWSPAAFVQQSALASSNSSLKPSPNVNCIQLPEPTAIDKLPPILPNHYPISFHPCLLCPHLQAKRICGPAEEHCHSCSKVPEQVTGPELSLFVRGNQRSHANIWQRGYKCGFYVTMIWPFILKIIRSCFVKDFRRWSNKIIYNVMLMTNYWTRFSTT